MLLKGSQRAGGTQLANHLLNANDNDHVSVYEVSGFMADDVHGAFREMQAVSKGTNVKQFMFSLSLNPPMNETVSSDEFIETIDHIAKELKLDEQPRVVVFHEKENRLHAHAVFSRIDAEHMRGINLPFFKNRLNEISRDIYLEKGWALPEGFINKQKRDPLNYSHEEYQQAKQLDQNPRLLKALLKSCWDKSDNKENFEATLKKQGFFLARGDRRGFVAVTMTGKPLSLSRWLGVKSKDLKAKLGDAKALPNIEATQQTIEQNKDARLENISQQLRTQKAERLNPLLKKRHELIEQQKQERQALKDKQATRLKEENLARQARYRSGLKGLWDRVTGRHKKIINRNDSELKECQKRDAREWDALRQNQFNARAHIVSRIQSVRSELQKQQGHLCRLVERSPSHNGLNAERQSQNQKSKHRNHLTR